MTRPDPHLANSLRLRLPGSTSQLDTVHIVANTHSSKQSRRVRLCSCPHPLSTAISYPDFDTGRTTITGHMLSVVPMLWEIHHLTSIPSGGSENAL
nr:hypothetical protein Iba_chr03aCG13440 [Ipomoea batatas]